MRGFGWKTLVVLLFVSSAVATEDREEEKEDEEGFDYFQMLDDAHRLVSSKSDLQTTVRPDARAMRALEKLASSGFHLQVQEGATAKVDVEGQELPADEDVQGTTAQHQSGGGLQAPPKLSRNCSASYNRFVAARDSLESWALMKPRLNHASYFHVSLVRD